jgi:hypothetical protein
MSLNESNSIICNMNVGMNCFSYSCRDQISTWLWVHFLFTWYLSITFIVLPIMGSFIIGRFIWAVYQCCSGRSFRSLRRIDEQGGTLFQCRLRQLNRFLIYELKSIFFYTLACSTLELIKGNSIQWISMTRWLIEASYIPTLIASALIECYIFPGREYLIDNDPRLTYIIVVYPSKAVLFLIMRYIEIYPLSTINHYQIMHFYSLCNTSHFHWICVDYHLQLTIVIHRSFIYQCIVFYRSLIDENILFFI